MNMSTCKEVKGTDVGYSGPDHIEIFLRKMVELGGTAQTRDLYAAMEAVLNPQGYTLSSQGESSVRFFTNTTAVNKGYIYPYDKENPGWHITPLGRRAVESEAPKPEIGRGTEETLEDLPKAKDKDLEESLEGKGLLVHVERVLGGLQDIDPQHLPGPDSTTLVIEGSPGTLLPAVRSMMDHYFPGEVLLKLTLNRHGWHAVLDAHPKEE